MLERIAAKARQIKSFRQETNTPLKLALDVMRLKRAPFIAETNGGLKLRIKPSAGESFTFYENLIRRDYFTNGIIVKPGFTVVDVGANIGAFSILAASIVGPSGRVVAFEPMPDTFERLKENVALNDLDNVECRHAAIDAEEGVITLRTSKKSAYASAHDVNGNASGEAETTAPCLTLERVFEDHRLDRIDLLKVDCEGSEYGIFESLRPELAARIKQIAMEVHPVRGKTPSGLQATLTALGFEVHCGYPWTAFNRGEGPREA
jgi:FkbM family methyltransferase